MAPLARAGYIESIKQLRETLLISEWDLSNRHLAKRRCALGSCLGCDAHELLRRWARSSWPPHARVLPGQ